MFGKPMVFGSPQFATNGFIVSLINGADVPLSILMGVYESFPVRALISCTSLPSLLVRLCDQVDELDPFSKVSIDSL